MHLFCAKGLVSVAEYKVAVRISRQGRSYDRGEEEGDRRPSHLAREQAGDDGRHTREDHGDASEAVGETPVLVVVQRPRGFAAKGVIALDLWQVVTQQHEPDADGDSREDTDRAFILRDDAKNGQLRGPGHADQEQLSD